MFFLLMQQLEPLSLLKKLSQFILILFSALLIFLLYVIFTPSGTKIALLLLSDLTPYQIQYRELKGTLAKQITFEDLHLITPDYTIAAKQLAVHGRLSDLFLHKSLRSLQATDVAVYLTAHPTSSKLVFPTINDLQKNWHQRFPFELEIEHIALYRTTFYWRQQSHRLDRLVIKHASTRSLSTLRAIHYQGSFGSLDALLDKNLQATWQLNLPASLIADIPQGLSTQGHIVLMNRQWDEVSNQLKMDLQTKVIKHQKINLQDVSLQINGTLSSHDLQLHALYQNHPLQAKLHGEFSPKKWQADLKDFEFKHPQLTKMNKTYGRFNLAWGKKIVTSMQLSLWSQLPILAEATIDRKKPHRLSANIKGQIDEIKTLAPLHEHFSHLQGKLLLDLNLHGTLKKPKIAGNVSIKDAQIKATPLGSKAILNQLDFTIAQNNLEIKGKGHWGGAFTLTGQGNWSQPIPQITLYLKGDKLLLSDTPEYYIVASPDLKLSLNKGIPTIEGKIFIPHAEIQSLKNQEVINPSSDVVIVSAKTPNPQPERSKITQLMTDIEIVLGDKITYKGLGLSSNLNGKLQIKQQLDQLPIAKGKLNLFNGKYRAYGKTFEINYGQILFSGGPITDPELDIRAQRKIQPHTNLASIKGESSITAGIKLTGTFKTPKIEFYSTPLLAEADIISYLVVGRPQRQINEAQAELLFQAISQLTHFMGKSRTDIRLDLAEQFKLDQLGLTKKSKSSSKTGQNPLENTMLVMGKQLSDRLYLHYSVGLLHSTNNLGLRYLLGKSLTFEASTGTEGSSADLLLSFDSH